ncbi:MAG TPA: GMC family oxidoreductase [Rhodopila sp.]|uniref:GMC family oxidoreductase n=1 Tax=Rhodopila sp. TaxID=2480087 RepID=UPI002BD97785|nr:GMC family oxidoreductase [Rhodopila sp.]HVY15177.1 GMC family oxidoreductase [Rhodopila sp.]
MGRIVLVEAGNERFRSSDNDRFFKAETVEGTLHPPTELNRRRMLGGTTTVWGGRCIPFDEADFAPAPGRDEWPISYAAFASYVPEALTLLDAGPAEFAAANALPNHPVPLAGTAGDLVLDRIERYSKPTNVWAKFGKALVQSENVTVISNATCTNVLTNGPGTRVAGLELRTETNRRHTITAGTVVLACGGLETPRLMLASRGSLSCGLGNARDLVGRFYMTHLVSSGDNAGAIRFANPETAWAFDFHKTVDGVYGRRMMLLSETVRRRDNLPNIVFRPSRPPIDDASHANSVLSTMFLVRNLLIPPEYARSLTSRFGNLRSAQVWRDHVPNILLGLPGLARFSTDWLVRRILASRKLPSIFLYRKDGLYPLEFNAEQVPNPESRVRLGQEADPLGMPRLIVDWRYHEAELEAICRAYHALATSVASTGLGEVALDPDFPSRVRHALVPQGGHHIGTVRMGTDASTGVVDTHCEVWGTRGLFVAGTSVLPTSGFANPTLTALALALRLADHLVNRRVLPAHDTATSRAPMCETEAGSPPSA